MSGAALNTALSGRARRALNANIALQTMLKGCGASLAMLDILLFLAIEDFGGGVTTSRCCDAVQAPRTTALRWISNLAALQLVEQIDDDSDHRITRLRLTPRSSNAISSWLEDIRSE